LTQYQGSKGHSVTSDVPIIGDILRRRKGYKIFTKLGISMQSSELDEESKYLCTFATAFGKFKYNILPMGLISSPNCSGGNGKQMT
jgi:hypothetical protein